MAQYWLAWHPALELIVVICPYKVRGIGDITWYDGARVTPLKSVCIYQSHFMVYGTLYKATNAGDELRGRAILPAKFVEYYNLDIELSDPDSHFPSEYPIRAIPAFRYEDGDILTESIPISFLRKY